MQPFTLDDLESRDRLDAGASKPARLAVIGQPVGHSASPRMHQPALDHAGIDARYVAIEVDPGCVAECFKRLRALGFLGCNVTVPHKFDALDACDELDEAARELGAVNTVRFDEDATRGSNTDGYGFEAAVFEAFGLKLPGARVTIIGAGGGAGGAIAAHCARAGVGRLILVNRTLSKIVPLVRRLQSEGVETVALGFDDPTLQTFTRASDLVVNSSSLGLKPDDPSPIPPACFSPGQCVFDSIYQPPRTRFLDRADAAGARIANGGGMLLHQGVAAFRFWFPGSDPEAAMRAGLGLESAS